MRGIFVGHYFYGICAAALSAEMVMQATGTFPPIKWLLAISTATLWFYTRAFLHGAMPTDDERTVWLQSNRNWVRTQQCLLPLLLLLMITWLIYENLAVLIANIRLPELLIGLTFPLIALLYDSRTLPFRLRERGFLKPFVISLVWTGGTGILPLLWLQWTSGSSSFTAHHIALLLHRWMFLAVIAAAFDIKDYADDAQASLRTWVVRSGLRRVLFQQLLPLTMVGCISLLLFARYLGWQWTYTAWMALPMGALPGVLYSLRRRQSLIYYLTVVDGLMIVQAVCGIAACM